MMKVTSNFAIVDVKDGRKQLVSALKKKKRFNIVINGTIDYVHSRDGGISQEFAISVNQVDLMEII